MHHGGKWFKGEHEAIVDRATFDRVQQLLATKSNGRKAKRSDSGALLVGKLYDDKGNRMSPSFSSKNGVRYRFYVSSALLRGRQELAGPVGRISAQTIEQTIVQALRTCQLTDSQKSDSELIDHHLLRAQLSNSEINLSLHLPEIPDDGTTGTSDTMMRIPWVQIPVRSAGLSGGLQLQAVDHKLVQAMVRAHIWTDALTNAEFLSVEDLAARVKLHPKVVRNEIRLAFLAPEISDSILAGGHPFDLPDLRRVSALSWRKQLKELQRPQ